MRSKLLIYAMMVVFLTAVSIPANAFIGPMSHLIEDGESGDEHPWGDGNQAVDVPDLASQPFTDPEVNFCEITFFGLTINHYWISIRYLIWEDSPVKDVNSGGRFNLNITPTPFNDGDNSTGQGSGSK
jgi:hypothetical protein